MVDPVVNLINDWAAAWGPYFLLAVIQNTLFLALIFLILRMLRRAPARILSLVATLGVVKLAIPPFLPLGWMNWLGSQPAEHVAQPVSSLLFPFADLGAAENGFASGITGGFTPVALLMLVWASVALARLGNGLLQTIQLAMDIQGAEPIDDSEIPIEVSQRGLSVWQSERIALPLTLGIRPRRIFVPASWNSWPATNRRSVLLHELAHVRRRDGIVQALEIFAQALFFFLPPATLLIRRLHGYREMACDDVSVAADPHARLNYSRFLCSLAESVLDMPQATASASALARRKNELLDRVAYQVKEGVVKSVSRKQLFLILAVLVFSALPLSLVYGGKPKPKDAPPPPPPAKTETIVAEAPDVPNAPPVKKVKKVKKDGEEMIVQKVVKKDAKNAKDVPPPPSVKVAISGGKELTVAGQPVKLKEFRKAVKVAVAEKGGKAVINIDSDGGVTMKLLHRIQGDLKEMGLLKVIYSGELGEAVPMVLPPDEARKKLKSLPKEKIIRVKVDAEGVVKVGEKKIKGAHVPEQIRKLLSIDARRIVVLHTEPDTKYGAFVQVLDSIKKGGANKIAIADPED